MVVLSCKLDQSSNFIWFFTLFLIMRLARTTPELEYYEQEPRPKNIFIASELAMISDKLCLLWTSTRDCSLRKFNYPCNYRYGLELQIKHKNLHLLLCILLAGDIATNPGSISFISKSQHKPRNQKLEGLPATSYMPCSERAQLKKPACFKREKAMPSLPLSRTCLL